MRKILEKINEKLKPYYALMTMILFFGGLFTSAYKFVISPTDLRITIESERTQYPSSIVNMYNKIYNHLVQRDTLIVEAGTVYSFLIETTESKKIELQNISSKTIRGVKFKQLNADELTAWGITSDFLTTDEEQKLKQNLIFDETKKVIYLNNPIDISPNSQVTIFLWGSFKPDFFSKDIIVNHDNGEGHIEKAYTVSGLKGYFVNYAFEFIIIMLFIFIGVYYVGIKFAREKP